MHFTVQRRLRHSRHPAVAQPRLVAPKPSGLDQSRSYPKTYPPRTTTRLASGIRLRFAHTNSCGRTESKLGEMSKQLGPYGSPGQQPSLNMSTRAYHHGSTHLPVYHHGSAGSSEAARCAWAGDGARHGLAPFIGEESSSGVAQGWATAWAAAARRQREQWQH